MQSSPSATVILQPSRGPSSPAPQPTDHLPGKNFPMASRSPHRPHLPATRLPPFLLPPSLSLTVKTRGSTWPSWPRHRASSSYKTPAPHPRVPSLPLFPPLPPPRVRGHPRACFLHRPTPCPRRAEASSPARAHHRSRSIAGLPSVDPENRSASSSPF